MAVIKPRNKILIFRLTDEEYSHLRDACTGEGARSLSEFARQRLLSSIGAPPIDARLSELSTTVRRIEKLLERA